MPTIPIEIKALIFGWVLAQLSFILQRKSLNRADISKSLYFLIYAQEELDFILHMKEQFSTTDDFAEVMSEKYRSSFITKESFAEEMGAACEKIAATSIKQAYELRNRWQAVSETLCAKTTAMQKITPTLSQMTSTLYLEALKTHNHYI